MNKPTPIITTSDVLERARWHKILAIVGWIACAFLTCSLVYSIGLYRRRMQSLNEIDELRTNVYEAASLQRKSTEALVRAWQDQRKAIELVVEYGRYVKETQELSQKNVGMIVPRPKMPRQASSTSR